MKRRLVPFAVLAAALPTLMLCFDPPPPEAAPGELRGDAALVLSGDVDFLRTQRAIELWRAGVVPRIAVTGQGIGGDSGPRLARVAQEAGVPESQLIVEQRSRSTRENLEFVAPLLRAHGLRRVVLVTSRSHLLRALAVARRSAPDLEWVGTSVPEAGPLARDLRNRFTEWIKLFVYAARGWL